MLSDTHGLLDSFILKYTAEADEIWHAGDIGGNKVLQSLEQIGKPIRGVFGNIDGQEIRSVFPEILKFTLEGVNVLMTHIGGYPEHYPSKIKSLITSIKPSIFICGHSHILRVIYDKDLKVLTLNPGAAGIEGFHQKRTMLRFCISPEQGIYQMEIIEKEKN